jgi:FkbM family methyltransferase
MQTIKQIIKRIIDPVFRPIAAKVGYVPYKSKTGPFDLFLMLLSETGYRPKHIIDIGANYGNWTKTVKTYFPQATYSLFEPLEKLIAHLQKMFEDHSKVTIYQQGVGAISETRMFTIVERDDSCSFNIDEDMAMKKGFVQVPTPIVSIDDFLNKHPNLETPDIIKIDAEGLDLEVLKGMVNRCMGQTELIFIEAAILNKEFENNMLNVMNAMNGYGYTLLDITDLMRPFKFKGLWLTELVFVKRDGVLIEAFYNSTIQNLN